MTNRAVIPVLGDISRITLLGLLSFRPMHGYELRRVIEARHMDKWADVQAGSIYAGLRRLAHEGLVDAVVTERVGNRPPRTVYRITDAGAAELERLLQHAWSTPVMPARAVDVALSFYHVLSADEIIALLEGRIRAIETAIADLKAAWLQVPEGPSGMRSRVHDIFEHRRRMYAAEQTWSERTLARARAGAYRVDNETMAGRVAQTFQSEHTHDDEAATHVGGAGEHGAVMRGSRR